MKVMTHVCYPATRVKDTIQAYTSSDLPPVPTGTEELGSIVYLDRDGHHAVHLFETGAPAAGPLLEALFDRARFLASRVEGLTFSYHTGFAVEDSIARTRGTKILPT